MARDIKIQFLGDESDLSRATRAASGDLDHFSKRAGVVAGVVSSVTTAALHAAATGARALVTFTKGALAEAEEAQRIGRVTATIVKSTGGAANVSAKQIGALTEHLSNLTGIDDEVIQAGTNVMLTFRKVRNEAGKGNKIFDRSQQAALDLSAVLGTDLTSANLQLGKALNDPVKGMTALRRSGISFTEQQIDQVKAMVKSNDVLGAQRLILDEVQKEVGGAAEANASATQRMTTAWKNFQEDIGKLILPAFEAFVNWFSETALPAIEDFTHKSIDVLARWGRGIADAFGAGFGGKDFESKAKGIQRAIENIANAGGKAFRNAVDVLKDLGRWAHDHATDLQIAGAALAGFAVGMKAVTTASKGVTAVQGFSSAIGPLVGALVAAGPPGWIAGAVLAVAAAAVVAYLKVKPFRDLVDSIGDKFQENAPKIAEWLNVKIPQAAVKATESLQRVNDALGPPFLAAVTFAAGVWQQYGDQVTGITSSIAVIVTTTFRNMVAGVQSAFGILASAGSGALAQLAAAFNIFTAIVGPIWAAFLAGLQQGWNRFGGAIVSAASTVFNSLRGVIEGVLKIIQGNFEIMAAVVTGSWSRLWGGLGNIARGALQIVGNIVRGSFAAIEVAFRTLDVVITGIWSAMWNTLARVLSGWWNNLKSQVDQIKNGIESAFRAIKRIVDDIKGAIKSLPGGGLVGRVIGGIVPGATAMPPTPVAASAFTAARTAPSLLGTPAMRSMAIGTAPASASFARPIVVNLPEGVDGQNVVNAITRYTRRNGVSAWRR